MTTNGVENRCDSAVFERLQNWRFDSTETRVIWTAAELGIFSRLPPSGATAYEAAHMVQANARSIRMLLDVLVSMGLLSKLSGAYVATEPAKQLLDSSSPTFLSGRFEAGNDPKIWPRLTEVIRTGKPVEPLNEASRAAAVFEKLIHKIHIEHEPRARRLATALLADGLESVQRVLDIAAGSGVWGIALAQASSELRITVHDRPEILPITREYIQHSNLSQQFDYLPGDLRDCDFGEAQFDIAILGNIVHWEGEAASRELLRKLHRALAPAGRIVIIEMIPNDNRTGPTFALMFALNTLLFTDCGDTYTFREYDDWLRDAGYCGATPYDIGSHSAAIIARRI